MSEERSPSYKLCRICTEEKIKNWKGVPRQWPVGGKSQKVLPELYIERGKSCEDCGGEDFIRSTQIAYLNHHYGTGLPDYFTLKIFEEGDSTLEWLHSSFKLPYRHHLDFKKRNEE